MKDQKFRKVIVDLFAYNQSIDAGGVNYVTNTSASPNTTRLVNAYSNNLTDTNTDWSPEKGKYYHRVFLKNYVGKQVHGQFGEKLVFPKHSGDIVNIRGITPYPTKTTPLTEGVTPLGNLMNFYYVEVPVYQYGAYTPITDYARWASRDEIVTRDAEELASQAGRTIEEVDAAALNAGQSVMYAPSVSGSTVTEVTSRAGITALCKLTIDVIYRALNYLEMQNAEPIGDSYVAIIHPNVKYDIMTSEGFINVVKYQAVSKIFKGEIGMIGNIRFVVSTFAKVFAGAGAYKSGSSGPKYDVYSTLVIAKDAYKIVEVEGEGMKTIVKPLGSGGTTDPLDQRGTQGWKTTHGIGITGQTCMVRIESGSSSSMVPYSNEAFIANDRANATAATPTAKNVWTNTNVNI